MEVSPDDIVSVANTDINCDFTDPEIHPNGQNSAVVLYGGVPHAIEAGKTRLMPRYLAEHYRLHLVNHLLTKQNKQVNDPGRKELEKQVILDTVESFQAPELKPEAVVVAEKVEEMNEPVTTTATETVEPPPVEEPIKQLPTRRELFEECKTLGIETRPNDTVEKLFERIRTFSGV
jgi:hypothetical protein